MLAASGKAPLSVSAPSSSVSSLLDHAEAAEFALNAVEVAVMIGVAGDEAIAADQITCLHSLDHMDGERQTRDPRFAVKLVLQIELRGRCVLDNASPHRGCYRLDQADAASARPSDRCSASAGGHRRVAAMTRPGKRCRCQAGPPPGRTRDRQRPESSSITRHRLQPLPHSIAIDVDAVTLQIDDVGRSRAVDVGQTDTLLIELVLSVEPRRVVHRHLGAETAVAQIRPVADFAVANANNVREAVTGEVGEKNSLGGVCKDDYTGPFSSSRGLRIRIASPKPSSASEGYQISASSSVIRMSA